MTVKSARQTSAREGRGKRKLTWIKNEEHLRKRGRKEKRERKT